MLTRLEVDGFKNLVGVRVELGPFTCIAGPNGVGKSNLFDAIRFLSLLAEHKLMRAAQLVRGTEEDPTDPRDLFCSARDRDGGLRPMRLAAEMLVPRCLKDTFGRTTEASITFLRYELELVYLPPSGTERFGRLQVQRERLHHINQSQSAKHLRWPHSAAKFRKEAVTGARRGGDFISTTAEGTRVVINTHQDGGSRGQPRKSPAKEMTATTVGATNSVDDPTIFAAKSEMLGWRMLALEPSAMRRPDKYWAAGDTVSVSEDGAHIPATLSRLQQDDPELPAAVASMLSDLIPVAELRVVANDANQQFELQLQEPGRPWLGARSLSDGTLRFLALATLSVDPDAARLICMEEPENGIHPSRLDAMLDLLYTMAVDPMERPDEANPLVQVLVNTHSPRLVQLLESRGLQADLLIAEATATRWRGDIVRTLRFRHRAETWRNELGDPGVGPGIALAYLTVPAGSQVSLESTRG